METLPSSPPFPSRATHPTLGEPLEREPGLTAKDSYDRCRGSFLTPSPHTPGDTPTAEVRPLHPPVVPIPQEPFLPTRRLQRLVNLFPGGQFLRYLCVGVFNTLFGYTTFVVALSLLNLAVASRFLYLTAPAASLITTPLNITVAYFGYKFFVFRTKGNYLPEWLKAFAVYGTSMIPGLVLLSALTRLLQSFIHRHAASLHATLTATELHLHGTPLSLLPHIAKGSTMAGYIAGALVTGFSTIFSFVGHRNVTFKTKQPA